MTLIGNLQIADSDSASLSDNVLLSQASGLLAINDSGSLSYADNVSLSPALSALLFRREFTFRTGSRM
jgi:hypothetical protein